MSSEQPNGTGSGSGPEPIKMSFGAISKKKGPLIKRTSSSAFGHQDDKVDGVQNDELIAGFDGKKVKSLQPVEEAKPLVIPKLANADWRNQALDRRRTRLYKPDGEQEEPPEAQTGEPQELQFGFNQTKRVRTERNGESGSGGVPEVVQNQGTEIEETEETLEQAALRKIMGDAGDENTVELRKLVLQGQDNVAADEVENFQRNLEDLPDEATLEDYDNVPVEEFGAALLRGMGWKDDAKGSTA
ncbi:hypothetical protein BGW38_010474 [Lunasporangiospora selenospora]|uniref:Spp2/MOS2 G-patch domain-containing protein n=1 Tax=Lunasporangiospora selenospora TaxID=979761 RepID=A0A9P6G1X4_9FUNG|nr:hypothetical protein BGW38_010474 [Lunasporangiospora selenospora]